MYFSFQCFLSSGRPCPVILSGAKDPGCRTVGCVCIRKNLSRHSEHVLLHPGFFSAARFRMTEKGVILSVSDTPPGHARIPSVSPPRSADSRRWPVTPRTSVRPGRYSLRLAMPVRALRALPATARCGRYLPAHTARTLYAVTPPDAPRAGRQFLHLAMPVQVLRTFPATARCALVSPASLLGAVSSIRA